MKYQGHFFSKYSKFYLESKNAIKHSEKVFRFPDNCIWTGSGNLYVLLREYSPLPLNVLTNSSKILDVTKTKLSLLEPGKNDEKVE